MLLNARQSSALLLLAGQQGRAAGLLHQALCGCSVTHVQSDTASGLSVTVPRVRMRMQRCCAHDRARARARRQLLRSVCDYCRARGLPAELEARLLRYFRFQARANPAPSSLTLNNRGPRARHCERAPMARVTRACPVGPAEPAGDTLVPSTCAAAQADKRSDSDGAAIQRALPDSLRARVAGHQFGGVLGRNQALFRGCAPQFEGALLGRLREVYVMPGEAVLRAGDMARELAFLAKARPPARLMRCLCTARRWARRRRETAMCWLGVPYAVLGVPPSAWRAAMVWPGEPGTATASSARPSIACRLAVDMPAPVWRWRVLGLGAWTMRACGHAHASVAAGTLPTRSACAAPRAGRAGGDARRCGHPHHARGFGAAQCGGRDGLLPGHPAAAQLAG